MFTDITIATIFGAAYAYTIRTIFISALSTFRTNYTGTTGITRFTADTRSFFIAFLAATATVITDYATTTRFVTVWAVLFAFSTTRYITVTIARFITIIFITTDTASIASIAFITIYQFIAITVSASRETVSATLIAASAGGTIFTCA